MAKLKKFTAFAASLFPSEVAYVKRNNSIQDEEILQIIDRIEANLQMNTQHLDFDPAVDQRKYSKLMKYFHEKLERIDVDRYYEWISQTNQAITTDRISPENQAQILKELDQFEPTWFHMDSFFRLAENYQQYLLRRFRKREYARVNDFLKQYQEQIDQNQRVEAEINRITERIVIDSGSALKKEDIDWMLGIFDDEGVSRKNRYNALLGYLMYAIENKAFQCTLAPMERLEKAIFCGEFYSRRILANFYANKLLVLNHLKLHEEAAYCGLQSIKHHTEDYLYYLNNYCSVLMHLDKFSLALEEMKKARRIANITRDFNRKLIFTSNLSRCLNQHKQFKQSVRLCRRILDELRNQIFNCPWHYFFRVFFEALLRIDEGATIIRLDRKYKLVERETQEGMLPYLAIYRLAAGFREVKLSTDDFTTQISRFKQEIRTTERPDLIALVQAVERMP
jgi:hypothetical protein